MSWMRASIGLGCVGLLAGVAGMFLWINDGSNYFGVAVALASAGFLTLVACVLARVFGSSHGSQDDAFRRGREMGYDSGYLEGRRTAKPVVVPMLRVVGGDKQLPVVVHDHQMPGVAPDHDAPGSRDQQMHSAACDQGIPVSETRFKDLERVEKLRFTPPILPVWGRQAQEQVVGWNRVVAWVRPIRIPLLAGVLSLALVGVFLVGAAMARPSVPAEALQRSPGSLLEWTVPSQDVTPALVPRPVGSGASVAVAPGASTLAPAEAGLSLVAPIMDANAVKVPASPSISLAVLPSVPISLSGVTVVAPAVDSLPAVTTTPTEPVVIAPVVPLTAAEQTAADALAAANLTKANAKAAADLTAANAKAAADLTAANAKAAADLTAANAGIAAAATAQAAADAAWAVAHP